MKYVHAIGRFLCKIYLAVDLAALAFLVLSLDGGGFSFGLYLLGAIGFSAHALLNIATLRLSSRK